MLQQPVGELGADASAQCREAFDLDDADKGVRAVADRAAVQRRAQPIEQGVVLRQPRVFGAAGLIGLDERVEATREARLGAPALGFDTHPALAGGDPRERIAEQSLGALGTRDRGTAPQPEGGARGDEEQRKGDGQGHGTHS